MRLILDLIWLVLAGFWMFCALVVAGGPRYVTISRPGTFAA